MRVILETARSGMGYTQNEGDEVEIADAEAKRLIASGQAREIETATVEAKPEQAVLRKGRRR